MIIQIDTGAVNLFLLVNQKRHFCVRFKPLSHPSIRKSSRFLAFFAHQADSCYVLRYIFEANAWL